MMFAIFLPAPLWLWFHVVSIIKLLRPDYTSSKSPAVNGKFAAN